MELFGDDGEVARAVLDFAMDVVEIHAVKEGVEPGGTFRVPEEGFDELLKEWWEKGMQFGRRR